MYVCLCYGVSESDVRRAAAEGAVSLGDLAARTGCATNCGSCAASAEAILAEYHGPQTAPRVFPLQVLAAA
ncbi:(2Fe-2S)-binding protein [Pseudomarimonas salicorniae]|uniref:Bacterioferritin-associated ferredoxin n=1 Tax=Pseudomarimonas salicorniae TaxID=2933270 RepID=A0ABT0GGE2_9GAMM|nr:(2Fe-2S)-binding protein [Lysobacter sp. CAU 1642]MCK7593600.1 (2Fe-2S)-binding protein [Lysobacter sp. CAU 1642]